MDSGTVYEAFLRTLARHREREFLSILPETAQHYRIQARSYTYAEAADEIASLAEKYAAAGLRATQRVGLMLENRPAMFFHWLALNSLGVSTVPLNTDWREAELEYVIGHSEMVAAVVPPARVEELRRAASRIKHELAVSTESDFSAASGTDAAPGLAARAAAPPPDINTECALLYTSGTTGRPKGCVLTNEYFLWAGTWYAGIGDLCRLEEGAERLLTPLPMTHMNAMACSTMVMLLTGGCIIPLDRFHPRTWWNSVRDSRATVLHYLGVMPAMLLGSDPSASDKQHRIRFGFGAGVSPRLHASFEDRFGFPLIEAWAMTETGCGAAIIASREPRKIGTACFGRPSNKIDCRVVTPDGRDAEPGEHGELLVRSHGARTRFGFFREYLKDPEATAQAWENAYFHTGDIVFFDSDGDFHFVDRKKNVIRRSGENISAVEVEGVLLQHPLVASVGVAAVPDEVRGDEVMACVVARGAVQDPPALARELVEFCLQKLAYYKAPGYVAFCKKLPLTTTEKIQRARLGELARERVGREPTVDLRSLKKRVS
ncbi:MAG: AMP-binding protein [Proteobacteria bacterium]|nr:AMP-binding protein [Pseudomonadota bacterium]